MYYAAAPVAGAAFLMMTIALLIACHMCRKQQTAREEERFRVKYSNRSFLLSIDERLATVNPNATIVRVEPCTSQGQGAQQPKPKPPQERTDRRRHYGATTSATSSTYKYNTLDESK